MRGEAEGVGELFGWATPSNEVTSMYTAPVLRERQNVLVVDTRLTIAQEAAERQAAVQTNAHIPGTRWTTVGAGGCTTPFDTLAILDPALSEIPQGDSRSTPSSKRMLTVAGPF